MTSAGREFEQGLSSILSELEYFVVTEVRRLQTMRAPSDLRDASADPVRSAMQRCVPVAAKGPAAMADRGDDGESPHCGVASNGSQCGFVVQAPVKLNGNGQDHDDTAQRSQAPMSTQVAAAWQIRPEGQDESAQHKLDDIKNRFSSLARLQSSDGAPVDPLRKQGFAQQIARSQWFDYLTLVVVCANALWLAVDLDANGQSFLDADVGFQVVDLIFCFFFVGEIVIRFLAFKRREMAFRNGWFVFDALMTFTMVFEVVLGLARTSGVGFLSVLRTFRLLRITRMAKVARLVPELRTLIRGVVLGIRSALMTLVVLLSISYAFALALRSLSMGTSAESVFPNVPKSLYVLIIQGMGPDNESVMNEISEARWYLGVLFALFLFLCTITIMNMLIGILCEVMSKVSSSEQAQASLRSMADKMQRILRDIDNNYDNLVSKEEFESMLEKPAVCRMLCDLDVDVCSLIDELDQIFDKNGEPDKKLPFPDFMESVLQYQATNAAAIRSISAMRKNMRLNMSGLHVAVAQLGRRIETFINLVPALSEEAKRREDFDELVPVDGRKPSISACVTVPHPNERNRLEPDGGGCCSSSGSFDL